MDCLELRKLFVGGLCETTTDESLNNYFSQYGQIKAGKVVMNPETGTSRKFGFIEYMDRHSADAAVESGPHEVDGKRIDTKLAVRKDIVDAIKNGATKLFVGGIPKDTTQEDVVHFFNNHELNVKVKDFLLKKNRETGTSRGFGFLTPENDHHLAKIAHVQHFNIKPDQKTECVIANENNRPGAAAGGRGGFQQGGRGGYQQGGRGGYYQGSGYGTGYDAYGNGYEHTGYAGGYGDAGYGAYAGYGSGYDQSGYGAAGYQSGYTGAPPATAGAPRGRGGRGQYHPYSR